MVIAVGSLPIAGPRCGIELGADPASIDDGAPRTAISEMVRKEALALLRQQLDRYRTRSHRELQLLVTEPEVVEVVGPSGTRFCIEVLAVWNNKVGGDIRGFSLRSRSNKVSVAQDCKNAMPPTEHVRRPQLNT